jgi:hypothetical protein
MSRRRTVLAACAANLLAGTGLSTAASAVLANTTAAPTLAVSEPPPEVRSALTGALWAGSARLRFFGLNVYDVRLWVTPTFRASRYAQHGLALELAYLRRLSGSSIAERSLQEMRRAGAITPDQAQGWLVAMQAAFPDVHAGDRLTGLHSPGVGARFWFNGQPRADIRDPEFSRLFFGIWLAESTSEPRLRSALLARAVS